jgi:ribosomal protein S18 acetylase RimI-like enzyme
LKDMQIMKTYDYEAIAHLNKDVHDVHFNLYPEYFKEYDFESMKEFFKRIMDKPNFTFLLLENDQRYIGYAWLEIKKYTENEIRMPYTSVYLHHLSIIEAERNKGFGGKLMEKITEIAIINNIRKIELDYWIKNDVSKEFFSKNGYKKYREFVFKEI